MKNISDVLALKYRPQTFQDLIGHEEVGSAIYNSIKTGRSSNAYLFSGIRGIGKTTFARIVAKALNCTKGIDNLCSENFCENCDAIISSNHIDVLEIDAASNTSVDNVRELIEFSRYGPTSAKYKIFIIDEVHMLSKQAFNALLKTLEEPPKYLKFILATTEVKKIPITVISRCQRYDLSRIGSNELFDYLKKITNKENRNIDEKALKLIVKISEGSVRDSLSLLDRAFISNQEKLLTLDDAQKIFGYVDKSSYIDLLEFLLKADEQAVIKHYRSLYSSGVDPNNFLNEFLEVLYFVKNIKYIKLGGSSFSLNDKDFEKIEYLSTKLSPGNILLFWEFTLKTIKEVNIVNNPNLSIEMFLVQLMYLNKKNLTLKETASKKKDNNFQNFENKEIKRPDAISQIKNIKQEDEEIEKDNDIKNNNLKNVDDLIKLCYQKKEMKLKYELENNVRIVSFLDKRIEISFNEKLNKNFVKELSKKLFEWTKKRWIISFSKKAGEITKKELEKIQTKKYIEKFKNSDDFKSLMELIPDIQFIDTKEKDD